MNPLDLFNGQITFKRIYLHPPSSRRIVPEGMKDLDKILLEQENASSKKNKEDNKCKT